MMRRSVVTILLSALVAGACGDDSPTRVQAPAAPLALEGSYYAGAVTLTWELSPEWDGESFRVYSKRVTEASHLLIADVTSCADGVCTYTDTNIDPDVTYDYFVAAWDPDTDVETPSAFNVEVFSPARIPPPVPDAPRVIALDASNYLVWGAAALEARDFSFYRVYQAGSDGSDFLLGETDSEGFLDLRAENGVTSQYFVTSVDVDGHESAGSVLAEGTPRPDYAGELLFDYRDVPDLSGFRFPESESVDPVLAGDDVDAHFSVERDEFGAWWLVPGPDQGAVVNTQSFPTTALKCGVGADAECLDQTVAPQTGYLTSSVELLPERTYFLRVIGDDGQVHFGAIRIVMQGFDQDGSGIVIFDWAFQLQPGNPSLTPGAS